MKLGEMIIIVLGTACWVALFCYAYYATGATP